MSSGWPNAHVCGALLTHLAEYKYLLSVDEGLDIFAIHGVGGFIGDLLTGIFAARFVPALDGVSGDSYDGGWWDRNFRQLGLQLAGALTCAVWSFVVSCILLFVINKIPGLHIRESEEHELRGLDYKYLSDVEWEDHYTNGWTTPRQQAEVSSPAGSSTESTVRHAEPVSAVPTKQE